MMKLISGSKTYCVSVAIFMFVVLGQSQVNGNTVDKVIKIRKQVAVVTDKLYLKDLASNAQALQDGLKDIAIMDAPPMGKTAKLALVDLAYKLQQYSSLLDKKLRGPESIEIRRRMNWGKIQARLEELRRQIKSKSPWNEWMIDVEFGRDDKSVISNLSGDRFQVQMVKTEKVLGEVPLYIAALDTNDRGGKQSRVTPVIKRKVQGVVLKESKERGSTLKASDLKTADLWVEGNPKKIYNDISSCAGRQLSRRLGSGQMLKKEHIVEPLSAERGDLVMVDFNHDNLQIQVKVQALESGRKGERVRVRNPNSNKVFSVKLTGERRAQLGF